MLESSSPSIFSALVAASKKGGRGPLYARYINRNAAIPLTWVFWKFGLTPNAVSFIGFATTHLALTLLVLLPTRISTAVLVYFLLALGYVIDSCDGQLARVTGKTSPLGEWLDHTADMVKTLTVNMAMGYVLIRQTLAHDISWTTTFLAIFLNLLAQPTHFFVINKTGLGDDAPTTSPQFADVGIRRFIPVALLAIEYGPFIMLVLLLPWPEVLGPVYLAYGIVYTCFAFAYFVRAARTVHRRSAAPNRTSMLRTGDQET